MRFKHLLSICFTTGMLSIAFSSCDDIYDAPSDMPSEEKQNAYTYVDCTDYKTWVYFNLQDGSQTPLAYDSDELPEEWTFAMHRYDCKTNGGSVYETSFSSITDLTAAISAGTFAAPDAAAFTADVDGKITVDMSHMMEGYLDYAASKVNSVMGQWLSVDTSNMPPNYTPSDKVYLLRVRSDEVYAIRFTAYSNPQKYNTKGYISFDYLKL